MSEKLLHDLDAEDHALLADLVYVYDHDPGYARRRYGRGYAYYDHEGAKLTCRKTRARLNAMAVPPAWEDVWLCRIENGHIQATGYDAERRKQYRYHERWRDVRDRAKFHRLSVFGHALPRIRRHIAAHLGDEGLHREKVMAALLRLLDRTGLRIGGDAYAAGHKTYGLSTLLKKHVELDAEAGEIDLHFTGKGGKDWEGDIHAPRVADILRACEELPGQRLFQYLDEDGARHPVCSHHINEKLRDITGETVTAKDFRTWHACVAFIETASHAARQDKPEPLKAILEHVAEALGNTPAMIRKSYVHPDLGALYKDGAFDTDFWQNPAKASGPSGLRQAEKQLLLWLESPEIAA